MFVRLSTSKKADPHQTQGVSLFSKQTAHPNRPTPPSFQSNPRGLSLMLVQAPGHPHPLLQMRQVRVGGVKLNIQLPLERHVCFGLSTGRTGLGAMAIRLLYRNGRLGPAFSLHQSTKYRTHFYLVGDPIFNMPPNGRQTSHARHIQIFNTARCASA